MLFVLVYIVINKMNRFLGKIEMGSLHERNKRMSVAAFLFLFITYFLHFLNAFRYENIQLLQDSMTFDFIRRLTCWFPISFQLLF